MHMRHADSACSCTHLRRLRRDIKKCVGGGINTAHCVASCAAAGTSYVYPRDGARGLASAPRRKQNSESGTQSSMSLTYAVTLSMSCFAMMAEASEVRASVDAAKQMPGQSEFFHRVSAQPEHLYPEARCTPLLVRQHAWHPAAGARRLLR